MEIGLLVLRLAVGFTLAAHGAQKLFGWFGGYGLAGTGGFFENLGFRPGKLHAFLAGRGRSRRRVAPGPRVSHAPRGGRGARGDAGGGRQRHAKAFFAQNGGFEYTLVLAAAALALAFAGPGPVSLDGALGLRLAGPAWAAAALGAGIAGGLAAFAGRRPVTEQAQPAAR